MGQAVSVNNKMGVIWRCTQTADKIRGVCCKENYFNFHICREI